jgi:hypothetical protein
LEWVAALLQELLILRSILSLLRLLPKGSSTNLSLRALQCSRLRTSPKTTKLLTSLHLAGKIGRNDALLALRCLDRLLISLLIERRNCLRCRKSLLAHKLGTLKPRTVTTEGPGLNSFRLLLRLLLSKLLTQSGLRCPNN